MCLVVYARDAVPGYRVVLAANRDEYHARPAQALHWWAHEPPWLAGRDQRAGGTWLGVRRDGRFACVLNGGGAAPSADAPSRGQLVPQVLAGADLMGARQRVEREGSRFAGFHLLAGELGAGHYITNTGDGARTLGVGCHVIDNTGLSPGAGRSRRARERFDGLRDVSRSALLALLGDTAAPADDGGDPRPVFLAGGDFGTRCSTLVWWGEDDTITVVERRFDAGGAAIGETHRTWPAREPGMAGP